MTNESNPLEQAVSRALRDNLDRLQRTAEELSVAIADLVSACASRRPTNALPPMLRAQTAATSLAAMLDVLAKFVTQAMQTSTEAPEARPEVRVIGLEPREQPSVPQPPPRLIPTPMSAVEASAAPEPVTAAPSHAEVQSEEQPSSIEEPVSGSPTAAAETLAPGLDTEAAEQLAATTEIAAEEVAEQAAAAEFDIAALSPEERELHRRANRVAKVSMQDIQLLRPEQVKLGRQHKDLCLRLRDDIEKAHKEYDRRFQPILNHPVDYFYHWMVEILAAGDPQALGEYPYSSRTVRQ